MVEETTSSGGGGGCFVATAAFGSMAANTVSGLTSVRDFVLAASRCSASLVELYYYTGSHAANALRSSNATRAFIRDLLEEVTN
ncbi:MAG: CFI-box-CTERM domain-containing protein [Planctomycetota bacterium]|nr:CFI-box-CTERM domain-containing protein [Planctomycetota bacterium]